MGIAYSILINICFFLFYLFIRGKTEKTKICFFIFPLVFNITTFFYHVDQFFFEKYIDFYSADKIKVFFVLFWLITALSALNKIVNLEKDEVPIYPLILLPFISLFKNPYMAVNTLVFVVVFFFLKEQNIKKRFAYVPIFSCIITMIQFFFFTITNENELNFNLYNLVFDLKNLSTFIILIPLVFYFLASTEGYGAGKYLMKFVFSILMIRLSTIIPFNNISLEVIYFIIFLSITIIMPLKKFDMTMYLFGVSFAFMIDENGPYILPGYYIIGLLLGEIMNILRERHFPFIHFLSGLLLLPYINPYVTKIFSHLNEIHIVMAVVFILYYAKLLSFTFVKRDLQ